MLCRLLKFFFNFCCSICISRDHYAYAFKSVLFSSVFSPILLSSLVSFFSILFKNRPSFRCLLILCRLHTQSSSFYSKRPFIYFSRYMLQNDSASSCLTPLLISNFLPLSLFYRYSRWFERHHDEPY